MGVSINLYMLVKEMFPKVPYDVGTVTCMHTCCTGLLLYACSTHSPSIYSFTRPHLLISALSMHLYYGLGSVRLPLTFWAHGSTHAEALSALPQHLPSPFSVILLYVSHTSFNGAISGLDVSYGLLLSLVIA